MPSINSTQVAADILKDNNKCFKIWIASLDEMELQLAGYM